MAIAPKSQARESRTSNSGRALQSDLPGVWVRDALVAFWSHDSMLLFVALFCFVGFGGGKDLSPPMIRVHGAAPLRFPGLRAKVRKTH